MKQQRITLLLAVLMSMMELKAFGANITFKDANVKSICVANWDTNGDGELSYDEAAAVTDLGEEFSYNWTLTSFNEFQYFTGLTSIGNYAFYDCSNLNSVTIPQSVTVINELAFGWCTALTSITIPKSVQFVGMRVFYNCDILSSIIVESGNTVYDSRDNCNAIIRKSDNALVAGCKNTVIPNSVEVIEENAFDGCSGLTSIVIPSSVTSIVYDAFYGCSNLTSVTIPSSVTSISGNPFSGCSGLTSIKVESGNPNYDSRNNCNAIIDKKTNSLISGCKNTIIPNTVTSIIPAAFYGCTDLTSITIPNSVTEIGYRAFYGCRGLTSITIPNSVTEIGYSAFYGCSGLTSATISNSVTTIGEGTFEGCNSLTSVTIPNSVTAIEQFAFYGCTNLKSAIIPNSVTSIETAAFALCRSLTSVTIPSSITSMGKVVFNSCTGLTKVRSLITEPFAIDPDCWYGVSKEIPLYVPVGTKEKYQATEGWNSFTNIIEVDNSVIDFADANVKTICVSNWDTNSDGELSYDEAAAVTDLGEVFRENINIKSFNELQYFVGVKSIGEQAFYGCSNLGSMTIPNSVTEIGFNAFSADESLTSMTIPKSVTSIGPGIFSGCSGLTTIVVEDGNPSYDSRNNCNAIIETSTNTLVHGCKNSTIPNSVTAIGIRAFDECEGLVSVTIPNSVTSIGGAAFTNCYNLKSVTIPNSVTDIGYSAFYWCYSLSSITIPKSVTTIGDNAFISCDGLTSIVVEKGNPVYDSRDNCNAIIETSTNKLIRGCKNTIIPKSVTIIGKQAFFGCWNMPSITIPNSVTIIGAEAFYSCRSLTSINIPNSVTTIGVQAFIGCSGLTSVTIPSSVTLIASNAFKKCSSLTSVHISDMAAWCRITFESESSNPLLYAEHLYLNGKEVRNLVIPDGVTSIGFCNFIWCTGLTSVTIPSSVTSIGMGAFYCCSNLTSVTILNGVTTIGNQAFENCNSLESLTIPSSVTDIGWNAFNCSNLTAVIIDNPTPVSINPTTFPYSANATLYVPAGSKAAYEAAANWQGFKKIVEMGVVATYDVNNNGVVDNHDVNSLVNKIMGRANGTDDTGYTYDINNDAKVDIKDVTFVIDKITHDAEHSASSCPDNHHPHWIDLGLPSGTQWRCCNEGASTPEAYGGYYTFGQVSSAPSNDQFKELLNNCTSVWTTQNRIYGRMFTGPNGSTIFLPAAGHSSGDELYYVGSGGYYWSSTLYLEDLKDFAKRFYFNLDNANWDDSGWYRELGQSVRPVRKN